VSFSFRFSHDKVDTEVHTLQADLCEGLNITYTHKAFLGSLVQAGIKDLSVQFEDYPDLNFKSGVHILREEYGGYSFDIFVD
jgi:hypothetical protein